MILDFSQILNCFLSLLDECPAQTTRRSSFWRRSDVVLWISEATSALDSTRLFFDISVSSERSLFLSLASLRSRSFLVLYESYLAVRAAFFILACSSSWLSFWLSSCACLAAFAHFRWLYVLVVNLPLQIFNIGIQGRHMTVSPWAVLLLSRNAVSFPCVLMRMPLSTTNIRC